MFIYGFMPVPGLEFWVLWCMTPLENGDSCVGRKSFDSYYSSCFLMHVSCSPLVGGQFIWLSVYQGNSVSGMGIIVLLDNVVLCL